MTAAEVIARLKERRDRGLPLNSAAIQKEDSSLANAIVKYFRFHDRALRAAGIDPRGVVKLKRHKPAELATFFAQARRIAQLRGEPHRRAWLRFKRKYAALAAEKRFGGWKGVAKKIGVPRERLVWQRFRNRQDVIAALRERIRRGKSLQSERVLREDISLRTAVIRYLGSLTTSIGSSEFSHLAKAVGVARGTNAPSSANSGDAKMPETAFVEKNSSYDIRTCIPKPGQRIVRLLEPCAFRGRV